MNMAISIGNSNVRVAVAQAQTLQTWQFPIAGDAAYELHNIFSVLREPVAACILSSVQPDITKSIRNAVRPHCLQEPIVASTASGFALDYSGYDGLLGIDRAICCEAVYLSQQTPFVMIDLGTATTINVVDAESRFIGGMILPGVQMGLAALSKGTALLPHADLRPASPLLGRNTTECLLSGAIYGTASLLDAAINRIWANMGMRGHTVITGGNAPFVIPAMQTPCQYEEHLIMTGLFTILERVNEVL